MAIKCDQSDYSIVFSLTVLTHWIHFMSPKASFSVWYGWNA